MLSLAAKIGNRKEGMDRERLKTSQEWIQAGRHIIRGERAEFYLLSPDGSDCRALFDIEQTAEIDTEQLKDWTEVIPAADRPTLKKKSAKPKAIVDYNSATKVIQIWVGSNKTGIRICQNSGYRFDGRTHRWIAQKNDYRPTVDLLEDHYKFEVDLTVDGKEVGVI